MSTATDMVQKGRADWQRRVDTEKRIAAGGSSVRYQTPNFKAVKRNS